ncbi:ImmA/IrrE family metallo-endopeptidase [Hungatella hathewayi]|uniref:ImmA/IrrE family metallo-endopeptidase n=1 Tax=Hungatella hathewayi TaxID=154046 RepID=UPI0011DCC994|nr:ImmA/IrrE family metallo-endopeptidase [Hungatella hathewayi]
MMEKILLIYVDCGISSLPLDCYSVLEFYGFRIFTYLQLKKQNLQLYNIAITYTKDSLIWGDIIAYNEKVSLNRIRFSLMHEFGHYVLEHGKESQEEEEEADIFASNILAPRIMIHKYRCDTADQIHEIFGLSYEASNRALMDYRRWYENIAQTTHKPSEPERQLETLISLEKKGNTLIDYEEVEKEEIYEPTFEEKYAYIQRALRAGLPLPPEYALVYRMYRKMGLK